MGSAETLVAAPDVAVARRLRTERGFVVEHYQLIVLLFASFIFLSGTVSPPALMDDVDAVQAQIARNMLHSGDFVTARLDGVPYMEKAPLKYWLIAGAFRLLGDHDWAARLVIALAAILLCWITARIAAWGIGASAGLWAGLTLATGVGLFLFTRILIPDSILALFVAMAMWSFMRALDPEEPQPRRWALAFWVSLALGVLTKGLIAAIFPIGAAFVYLLIRQDLFVANTWRHLTPFAGIALFVLIAAPWHIAATLANPPYLDFTMHSERGSYHGFFWFYFINEQVLRFLNVRYPRDYNTVTRPLFWLLHAVWFFPWSVYLLRIRKLNFLAPDRASRTQLLALCWIGVVMVFFTLSTTQEYYSLPCYPAVAVLIGAAIIMESRTPVDRAARVSAAIAGVAALVIAIVLWNVRDLPTPGDISRALSDNTDLYTLSMGHMADLTFKSMAYLRLPLAMAFLACLVGALGGFLLRGTRALFALALMMVIFFQATHMALRVFDPYLSSKGLADALVRLPKGQLIVDDQYYSFSSVFFYADTSALLLNGRVNNLEYGSYAPGAPNVFIADADLPVLWESGNRCYLVADQRAVPRLTRLLGANALHAAAEAGGKYLFANRVD